MPKYEKTKDPNIIKKIETVESEIYLDILEEQIADLKAEIESTFLIKVGKYPDNVLMLIEGHNVMAIDTINGLQLELDKKRELLKMLRRLKKWE